MKNNYSRGGRLFGGGLEGQLSDCGKRMGKGNGGRKLRNIISAIIVIVPSRMTGSSLIHFLYTLRNSSNSHFVDRVESKLGGAKNLS